MRSAIAIIGLCAATLTVTGCAETSHEMKSSSTAAPAAAAAKAMLTPAQGYTIHVMAPHKFEDGSVHGPYHHYCKPISPEILQCLLFESTE